VVVASAKATGKGDKASTTSVKVARPTLAPVLSGMRSHKPTEATKALIEAEANKKKRKAPGSTSTTPSRQAACKPVVVDRVGVADHEVIDDMPSQPQPRYNTIFLTCELTH
jgi:hypothetical protein